MTARNKPRPHARRANRLPRLEAILADVRDQVKCNGYDDPTKPPNVVALCDQMVNELNGALIQPDGHDTPEGPDTDAVVYTAPDFRARVLHALALGAAALLIVDTTHAKQKGKPA